MMEEKKKFEVDELDNKGYKKESRVGKILKWAGGGLLVVGTTVVAVITKKGSINKDE